jgi:multicomponent Na+:H+ antiporter subunit D
VEVDDEADHPPRRRTPALLLVPVVALLAGSLALGLTPGLSSKAAAAGAAFEDRDAYASAVLHGNSTPPPSEVESEPLTASAVTYGLASGVGAVVLALVALFRRRWFPAGVRRRVAGVVEPGVLWFRSLQSGRVGDYAAWFTLGVAALGGLFALAIR